MSDIEAQVRAGLAELAGRVDPVPDPVAGAVAAGRALRARRARRTQALVAVVSVGLLATVGVLAHDSTERPTGSSGIATAPTASPTAPAPAVTGSSGASPAPGATTAVSPALAVWLASLRVGSPETTPPPNLALRYDGTTYVPQTNDPPPPTLVAPTSRGWLAIFIPDGFTGAPDPNTVLGLLTPPPAAGQPWTLSPLATGVIAGAAVSPDGTEVAYASVNPSTFEGPVIVRDLATGAVRATSPSVASAGVLGWGPDGVVASMSRGQSSPGWTLAVWSPGQPWRSVAEISGPGGLDGQAAATAPEVLVHPPATNGAAPCAEVLRLTTTATPARLWRGCGPQSATVGALSPDGRWVLTNGLTLVDVVTGARKQLAPAAVGAVPIVLVRWQDDSTVLVRVASSARGTTTLQCTVSGRCALAGPVLPPHPAAGAAAAATAGANAVADYLRDWAAHGPAAAAAAYLVPDQQIPPGQQVATVRLVTGWVSDSVLTTWVSPADFTLRVTLVLHFSTGQPWAAWGEGANTRFVHITKAAGATGYRLSLATGPAA